ncbi:NAD-dependent succinate-semialdehyde dehydrogenase [Pontibacter akesuensis]|uniref:Succinate-semialdehyde dehydrogenase / glutarate-semialdehyde dehydrogenase n=1 Tax=Pontibacter akesuensis TaxID=388950 RepID=A0A1I7KGV5_9BACT|nr:NAD-dependent succinate-semialdehyde dehydrogenase [Pontibacter akesuensis]GHA79153.1 succinate-semialdehyde dehydrogenase [Pontibacter akesuensis]SFU96659.1 succinate-semialdehyde dehydrogenase / glutarate-semialdehyde dehydrogenase [Pontibacter akesuensis]
MAIETRNPATGELIKTFTAHTSGEVTEKIEQAHQAFLSWRKVPFEERAKHMQKQADILEKEAEKYGRIISLEMGKPLKSAMAEVKKCATVCRYYAENAAEFMADEEIASGASRSFISYEPLGVVLAIMPWNFPFWQVYRFLAPALMAGNVGLLKHASNVPQCAQAIEEIVRTAGFPDNVFQSLLIGSGAVDAVIEHPHVKAVTLTGSELAGSKVAEKAGREIKKTVLELGGSDAFIVLDDADLEQAAEVAVKSRMVNTGQSCIAAKRFIVVESIAEAFLQKFSQKMQAFKTGDPLKEDVDFGPMARKDLAEELEQQVNDSVAKGAEVVLDGGRQGNDNAYFKPMILKNVKPGMPAYEEEMFGPVAAVMVVKDEDEAIAVANDSRFGLGGAVWTQDRERGLRVAKQVETGAMFVNALVASSPEMPFGGIKKSGYGRELSYLGIREFVNQKSIWID